MSTADFRKILAERAPELTKEVQERIIQLREDVLAENEKQNLTRLTSPEDFFEGHVRDVLVLLESGYLKYPALDIGCGGGVPGLLAAIIDPKPWILVDSETYKADFLQREVEKFNLTDTEVFSDRVENILKLREVAPKTITARAVGKVAKIYSWIQRCSTWNSLILFKGPAWEDEWKEFKKTQHKNQLSVKNDFKYQTIDLKQRRLIHLAPNVPRGTTPK